MKRLPFFSAVAMMLVLFSSCTIVGDIFKAGWWVGVLTVVIVVGLILYLISRGSSKN